MSTSDGLHVPAIPLVDVPGNTGAVDPIHTDWNVPKLKVGVTIGLTVTVKVSGVTHVPAVGVNTYDPLAWLLTTDGLHVPVKPLVEVIGSDGTASPVQIDKLVPKLNTGMSFGVTVNVKLAVVAHWPAPGVNV